MPSSSPYDSHSHKTTSSVVTRNIASINQLQEKVAQLETELSRIQLSTFRLVESNEGQLDVMQGDTILLSIYP